MGKVRAALFSMLESRGLDWPECRVLDLFAGSGSLGFEALSRGAAEVCFVESLPEAARLIRANALRLGVESGRVRVLAAEAGKVLGRRALTPYEVIFVDPPYGHKLLYPALKLILRNGWLREGGILNAEVENGLKFDPAGVGQTLEVEADRCYGQTRLVLWTLRKEAAPSIPAPLTP
jgi:16S rRNA (guanine966-N2)-methyltransferase